MRSLRQSNAFIPKFVIVAIFDDTIVGHILLTRAKVINEAEQYSEVLCRNPLSVRPDLPHDGIGTALMPYGKDGAFNLGYRALGPYGNPGYYERFGFQNARAFGITTAGGENFNAFMAPELFPHSPLGISGEFFEHGAFMADESELDLFDARFPKREKHVTDTQLKHSHIRRGGIESCDARARNSHGEKCGVCDAFHEAKRQTRFDGRQPAFIQGFLWH